MTEYASPINKSKDNIKENFKFLGSLIIKCAFGAVLSAYNIGGEIYPFGIAYTMCFNGNMILPVAISAAIGYIFLGKFIYAPKYLAGLILGAVFKYLFFSKNKIDSKYNCLLSALAVGLPSASVMILSDITIYNIIYSFTDIALAFGGCYFFSFAFDYMKRETKAPDRKEKISLVIFICAVVSAFYNITMFNINFGIVSVGIIIPMIAFTMGEKGGAIIGTALGTAFLVMDIKADVLPFSYAVSGLMAGIFKNFSKIYIAMSFLITEILFTFSSENQNAIYISLAFTMGTLIFLSVPNTIINKFFLTDTFNEKDSVKAMCNVIKAKLTNLSTALLEVKKTTDEVSHITNINSINKNDIIYDTVCNKVCKYCPKNNDCWQENYNITIDVFARVVNKLKREKEISLNDFPKYFKEKCAFSEEIGQTIANGYILYINNLRNKRQMERIRSVVSNQLEGVANLLNHISENVDSLYCADVFLENKITNYFESKKAPITNCLCYTDKDNKMTVEAIIKNYKLPRINNAETVLDLSDICERNFGMAQIIGKDDKAILKYTETLNLSVEFGFCQQIADNNKVCGDNLKQINEKDGFAYVILSDGMGTGNNAAIEAAMTTDMLKDLILGGSDFESAVTLVNTALISKQLVESFATVDIVSINLYTGETTLLKAASAPTFILRNNIVSKFSSRSLPIGILEEISPEKNTSFLKPNNIIINVSDGVTYTGEKWLFSEIDANKNLPPQALAEFIMETAINRRHDNHQDDITVSVMKICG